MSYCTANGKPVVEARISLPRIGVWSADLVIDMRDPIGQRVSITLDGGLTLQGTAVRSGVVDDVARVRVLGGAGKMNKVLPPKAYVNTPLRLSLSDIAREAGETLSSSISPALLGTLLPHWTRFESKASNSLRELIDGVAESWRILPDGKLWIGAEAWPDSKVRNFSMISNDPILDRVIVSMDTPSLLPGERFRAKSVSYVEHTFASDKLRTQVWYE